MIINIVLYMMLYMNIMLFMIMSLESICIMYIYIYPVVI